MNIYDEALKETQDFGAYTGLKLEKTIKALERAKKVEELKDLFMRLANNNYLMYQTDNPYFANKRTILLHEINKKEIELEEMK